MRHAYLVMAHGNWELLAELLSALDGSGNDIYLHIDKKAAFPKETLAQCCAESNLFYTKRYKIVWGGTQMMQCALRMLEEAQKVGYDYYHFLSGTDYPLKSQLQINAFFESHPKHQFIGFDWPAIESGSAKFRVQYYRFLINMIGKREDTSVSHRILARMEDLSVALQRKLRVNRAIYDVYKGSSWFSITHDAVTAIVREKAALERRFRFCLGADELWLQTYMMESDFAEQIATSNMRYVKWIQGKSSPEILTMADYDDLIASDMLFARKFDWNTDREIIRKLKEHIAKDTVL